MNKKSTAGGVLGIVGCVFAFIGALGLALCAAVADVATAGTELATDGAISGTNYSTFAWIFGLGAFACALVGAIFSFKKAYVGGILQAAAVVCIILGMVLVTWSILNIIALILLGIGAVLSFVVAK